MDDDKIRDIFSSFEPPLSGDVQFMKRLEDNMRSVELIREHNARLREVNRMAVAIAVLVGFVCGILFSFALPSIGEAMMNLRHTVDTGSFLSFIANNYLPIVWMMIACVSGFIAFNTFELSVFLLERKSEN